MADVKGITIEFKGDTIELDKSINSINNGLKALKNESQALNKALKLDPTSTELLQRKLSNLKSEQTLLTEKVKQYKDALANLGEADVGSKEWVKLNKELDDAESRLRIVNESIERVAKQPLTNLANQLKDIGDNLQNIGGKVEKVGEKLSKLSAGVVGLATAGVMYNAELERQATLFTTLTGSAEQANAVLDKIRENAKASPFDVQSLITANQSLIATGIEGDKSIDIINALGDAISATGGGNSELQRMAQNLQQIKNVGKASSMDIRQFAMAGIDIWGIMSDYTGKTVKQLQDMDITFDMVSGALLMASQEGGKYFGAMSAQSETLNGMISRLKSTFQELLGQLTETLVPVVKRVIERIQGIIDTLKNLSPEQQEQIVKIGEIIALLGPLLVIVGKVISFVGSVSTNMGVLLSQIIPTITASGQLTTALGLLQKAFDFIAGPIGIVIGLLVLTYQKSETFRDAVHKLVNSLVGLLEPAFNLIRSAIELVINIVKGVIDIFGDLISYIWDYTEFGNMMEDIFTGIVDAIQLVVDAVSGLIGWFQRAIDWANSLFNASNKASGAQSKVIQQANTRRGGMQYQSVDSGGLGLASGGLGLTANIHVTNSGQPIDESEVRRWANVMANQLDIELGRRF